MLTLEFSNLTFDEMNCHLMAIIPTQILFRFDFGRMMDFILLSYPNHSRKTLVSYGLSAKTARAQKLSNKRILPLDCDPCKPLAPHPKHGFRHTGIKPDYRPIREISYNPTVLEKYPKFLPSYIYQYGGDNTRLRPLI